MGNPLAAVQASPVLGRVGLPTCMSCWVQVYMKFAHQKEEAGNYEDAIRFFEKALDVSHPYGPAPRPVLSSPKIFPIRVP